MKKLLFPVFVLVLALGVSLPMAALVGAQPDSVSVYGIQRNTGEIYEIDPTTGDATLEFTVQSPVTPSSVGPNGLAYDEDNGYWYYTTYGGLAQLYFWDGSAQTDAGYLGHSIADGDFYDGKYYYIAGGTDDQYEVTFKGDGTIDTVIPHPDISDNAHAWTHAWTFDGDIAISPEGVIYGCGKCGEAGHGYEFFKVDRDGQNFQMIDLSVHSFSLQLAFGSDTLYGHESRDDGLFYAVDTSNGDLSSPFPNYTNYLYTDLASNPPPPPEEPEKRPPPDEAVGGEVYRLDKLAMMVRLGSLGLFLIIAIGGGIVGLRRLKVH